MLKTLLEDCYILVRNLCVTNLPDTKLRRVDCNFIKHFSPVKSYFAERLKFYNSKRLLNERVSEWEARVKSLASNCGFQTGLNMVMRDLSVVCNSDKRFMDRLFEEDVTKVKL